MSKTDTDIEIASSVTLKPIEEIAETVGIKPEQMDQYGKYKAKITPDNELKENGKLILVTAISPTSAGEGKTTTSVGLSDGLTAIGKKTILTLREPSLGPVFGIKGGAAGGGYAQVVPMEDINLHFTGDFHAIGAANNLLAAMVDNHIHHGNKLRIDPSQITWKRAVDMNDRQLRYIVDGLRGTANGTPREDGFQITVASEIMAIFCLAQDLTDLKDKLAKIIIGYNYDGDAVTAKDLKAHGAMAVLLKDAIRPNLVQTLEHTPAFVHGGPFANIAHGCNSVIATKTAMKYGDYVVTEAGFGADLGAEKFIDIKSRLNDISPDAVVLVATVRALKLHGGVSKENLAEQNISALKAGLPNLKHHLHTIRDVYGLPVVVAINEFPTDTPEELQVIKEACKTYDVDVSLSQVWEKGGQGATDLANKVVNLCDQPSELSYAYDLDESIEEKLTHIVQRVYGGQGIRFSKKAVKQLKQLNDLNFDKLPICVAKTQYSLSDDASLLGAPEGFTVHIENLQVSAGAGFIVALTGSILTMPGLPKVPSAENMDVNSDGSISGLF